MYSHTNIPNSLQTFTFTVGFATAEQKNKIFHEIQKIDPAATARTAPTGTMLNGKRVSRSIFQFIAAPGEEREVFFKLKLKYAAFTLHPSPDHAMLTAYGPV